MKKCMMIGLFIIMAIGLSFNTICQSNAATKVKLNKKRITLQVGKSATLKLKGTKKKVKWTSNNKAVATVHKGKVKAKNIGQAVITAKVGKKSYKCIVYVGSTSTSVSNHSTVCPFCNGTGLELITQFDPLTGIPYSYQQTCSGCGGDGTI